MLDEVRQKIAQIKKTHHKPSSLAGTPLQAGSQTSITLKGGMLFYWVDGREWLRATVPLLTDSRYLIINLFIMNSMWWA